MGFLPHENLDCMPLSILEIESDVMYDEDEEYQEMSQPTVIMMLLVESI